MGRVHGRVRQRVGRRFSGPGELTGILVFRWHWSVSKKKIARLRKIGNLADFVLQAANVPLPQCQPTMAAYRNSERHHTRSQAIPRFAVASLLSSESALLIQCQTQLTASVQRFVL